jgi:tetratricopeptide (TPR) repeat protein
LDNDQANNSHLEGADAAELKEFLASAPAELRGWANAQLASLDDPPPSATVPAKAAEDDVVGLEAFPEFSDDEPPVARPGAAPKGQTKSAGGIGRVNLVLVALLAAAIVIIVQQVGRSPTPETAATANPAATAIPSNATEYPALDEARETELKGQLETDPDNVGLLRDLGKLYFDSGLYQDAVIQFDKALQLAPDDVEVLLSLGVAEYSLNNYSAAEQHWLRATEVAPELPEPWYNLGFLYMAQTPPDYAGVERAWGKVVEIAPDSELAQTAAAHLERFRASSSSATPGG